MIGVPTLAHFFLPAVALAVVRKRFGVLIAAPFNADALH